MKTAIVTGTSHGLGIYIAKAFIKSDWHVIGTGRSARPDGLEQAIDYKQFDASLAAACSNFWEQLEVGDSEVCLVNNAGGYVGGKLLETKPEDYEKQMRSNYFPGVYMTRGLAEHVPSARIINVISNSALVTYASSGAYSASKAAAMNFFHSLQKEYPAGKYQVTNLYPSDIATSGPNPEAIDPSDLAALIVEIAETQASYYPTDMTLFPTKK
ncbi:MAG TPA: SDR family NAD(P)-dependent oxidoreductase [Candidatus Dormibacteraeota bacterium]|nr:SDR family NAD(P)-dependent oxidoreductase [Candidatus Dormibacteraeota bacterium]